MKKELLGIATFTIFVFTSLSVLVAMSNLNLALKALLIAVGIVSAVLVLLSVLSILKQMQHLKARDRHHKVKLEKLDAEIHQIRGVLIKKVKALETADENVSRQQTKLFDLVLNKNH